MTSRRGTVIEQGAGELLHAHGYTVRIMPSGFTRRSPPAHLVASKPGETRFIRIRKTSRRPLSAGKIETQFRRDIGQFRKYLAHDPQEPGLCCEIWTYSLCYGFRPFEIRQDSVREIPRFTVSPPSSPVAGGVA